ncbi:hypothetical protein ACFLZM_01200 [Thermodesulfobacteriota bacterium]
MTKFVFLFLGLFFSVVTVTAQDLSSKQSNLVKDAGNNLKWAADYATRTYSLSYLNQAKGYMEEAEKKIIELQKEIPDHPQVTGLEKKLADVGDALIPTLIKPVEKKIEGKKGSYDREMQTREKKYVTFYLDEIKKLLIELEKYKNYKAGEETYEKWAKWVEAQTQPKPLKAEATPQKKTPALPKPESKPMTQTPAPVRAKMSRNLKSAEYYVNQSEKYAQQGMNKAMIEGVIKSARGYLGKVAEPDKAHPKYAEFQNRLNAVEASLSVSPAATPQKSTAASTPPVPTKMSRRLKAVEWNLDNGKIDTAASQLAEASEQDKQHPKYAEFMARLEKLKTEKAVADGLKLDPNYKKSLEKSYWAARNSVDSYNPEDTRAFKSDSVNESLVNLKKSLDAASVSDKQKPKHAEYIQVYEEMRKQFVAKVENRNKKVAKQEGRKKSLESMLAAKRKKSEQARKKAQEEQTSYLRQLDEERKRSEQLDEEMAKVAVSKGKVFDQNYIKQFGWGTILVSDKACPAYDKCDMSLFDYRDGAFYIEQKQDTNLYFRILLKDGKNFRHYSEEYRKKFSELEKSRLDRDLFYLLFWTSHYSGQFDPAKKGKPVPRVEYWPKKMEWPEWGAFAPPSAFGMDNYRSIKYYDWPTCAIPWDDIASRDKRLVHHKLRDWINLAPRGSKMYVTVCVAVRKSVPEKRYWESNQSRWVVPYELVYQEAPLASSTIIIK